MSREWASRIVGTGTEDPGQLLANPRNWRIHPRAQQEALEQVLDRVGWVQNVIVNTTTGHVVDGHLRVQLALRKDEAEVPVVYVELTEDEEALILATIDPIGDLAATDDGALKGLLGDLEGQLDGSLAKMMADIAQARGSVSAKLPTQDEIDARAAELEGQHAAKASRMIDVNCPHCAGEFAIDLDEVSQYLPG